MTTDVRRGLHLFLTLMLMSILGGACSGVSSSPASGSCNVSEWSIDFARSGGFAGITRSMHLLSSGSLTASEPKRSLDVQTEASADELAQIGQLLQEACPSLATANSQPKGCPDCFYYSLQIEMGGQTFLAQATDVDKGNLDPLIGALNSLLDKALSGQP
jgi:hypothetical protein